MQCGVAGAINVVVSCVVVLAIRKMVKMPGLKRRRIVKIAESNNRRNALYKKDGYLCDRKGNYAYALGKKIRVDKDGLKI